MKYISSVQIEEALRDLQLYNAFFGVTFLVLKKANVPIGSKKRLSLDTENRNFLEMHYKVHPKSKYFFRVFRQNNKTQDWVKPDYASSGLQAINTQTFRDALLHEKNDNTWGWAPDYIVQLTSKLPRASIKIPLFHLAAWIYRDRPLEEDCVKADVVEAFINEFAITNAELDNLFETDIVSEITETRWLQELPSSGTMLASRSPPKDVPESQLHPNDTWKRIRLAATNLFWILGPQRLNLDPGDNVIGKTFPRPLMVRP